MKYINYVHVVKCKPPAPRLHIKLTLYSVKLLRDATRSYRRRRQTAGPQTTNRIENCIDHGISNPPPFTPLPLPTLPLPTYNKTLSHLATVTRRPNTTTCAKTSGSIQGNVSKTQDRWIGSWTRRKRRTGKLICVSVQDIRLPSGNGTVRLCTLLLCGGRVQSIKRIADGGRLRTNSPVICMGRHACTNPIHRPCKELYNDWRVT